jgi:tRNA (guanine26-N2/guanine27-N2)-dimethyltransferase
MKYEKIVEGATELLVPVKSLLDDAPPTSPVFFNPAASINRDVSVAITEAIDGASFCDSMAGVGARGVRIARETTKISSVTMVDLKSEALRVARRTASLNRVLSKCEFVVGETSSVLHSREGADEKFDFVDVDPFGTPIGQVEGAISATAPGGILSVTATDTAALCGVYPRVTRRRYGASPLNNHFHHETGIRILVGAICRKAASADIGVSPVAAHSTRHYMRVYVRILPGASKADRSLAEEGYIAWCTGCGSTSSSGSLPGSCEKCGAQPKVAGPLWLAALTEKKPVARAETVARESGYAEARKILRALRESDGFPPWSFSIEGICSSLGIATVSERRVRSYLSKLGFESARQPFETTGLKSDAPYEEVKEAVWESRSDHQDRGLGRPIPSQPSQ